tara:strand:- start:2281 stop:2523 length:243 start_codon:yes stop_codon:yes gene_type:complete
MGRKLAFERVPQEVIQRHYDDLIRFPHMGLSRDDRDEAVRYLGRSDDLGMAYESYLYRQRGRRFGNRMKSIFGHVVDALT